MDTNKERYDFNDLVEIIKTLRAPGGCPWDRDQTHDTIRNNLIEEAYEVINEIDKKNDVGLQEELGDILLQVVFHSQIAKEESKFDVADVIDGISKKMIYRHPHVFETDIAANREEAYNLFIERKNKEKKIESHADSLKSMPEIFPSLLKSYKIAKKFHKIQPNVFVDSFEQHLGKVYEEIDELKKAYENKDFSNIEEELGDVLCTVASLGQAIGVDSEIALNKNCKKVVNRIDIIEKSLLEEGEKIEEISDEKFKKCWQKAKLLEKLEKI